MISRIPQQWIKEEEKEKEEGVTEEERHHQDDLPPFLPEEKTACEVADLAEIHAAFRAVLMVLPAHQDVRIDTDYG